MIRREFLEKASLLAAGALVGFTPAIKGLEEARARRHAELWAFCMPGDPVYEGYLFADESQNVLGVHTNSLRNLVMPLSLMKKQMHYRTEAQEVMPGGMYFDESSPLSVDATFVQKRGTFVLHQHHAEGGRMPVWMTIEDLKEIIDLT